MTRRTLVVANMLVAEAQHTAEKAMKQLRTAQEQGVVCIERRREVRR